mmetsp:Transcript_23165/g.52584  ORF Transcript_23165/g.52584 Transcript_23165/m.52584 type:complete len:251 (+) Transcript_23165:486-1238(+)
MNAQTQNTQGFGHSRWPREFGPTAATQQRWLQRILIADRCASLALRCRWRRRRRKVDNQHRRAHVPITMSKIWMDADVASLNVVAEQSVHRYEHTGDAVAGAVVNGGVAPVRRPVEDGTTVHARPRDALAVDNVGLGACRDVEALDVAAKPGVVLSDDAADTPLGAQVDLHPARHVRDARRWRPRVASAEFPQARPTRVPPAARIWVDDVVVWRPCRRSRRRRRREWWGRGWQWLRGPWGPGRACWWLEQ